jgi:O-glycosyl hydrolase
MLKITFILCGHHLYNLEVHASKAGYTKWDLKRNEEVLKELKVEPILDYVCRFQNDWREHVNRISRTRIPKAIMYYQTRGKRSLGCPMKRWHENSLLRL